MLCDLPGLFFGLLLFLVCFSSLGAIGGRDGYRTIVECNAIPTKEK